MEESAEISGTPVLDFVKWWEKRRWIFNVSVGMTGLLVSLALGGLYDLQHYLFLTLIQIAIYGFFANVFYTLGWAIEVIRISFGKPMDTIGTYRLATFIAGTVLSSFLTAFLSLLAFGGGGGDLRD